MDYGGFHTSFQPCRRRLVCESCLLEWSPFEILLVSPARYTPLMTLLTERFRLVTFQSFCFTCYATCGQYAVSPALPLQSALCSDKPTLPPADLPLRLLDCLGFTIPFCFFAVFAGFVAGVVFRFGGGGFGAGFITGEDRKADGDGIVMVSIVRESCVETSMMLLLPLVI